LINFIYSGQFRGSQCSHHKSHHHHQINIEASMSGILEPNRVWFL